MSGITIPEACPICGGSKQFLDEPCDSCNGTGTYAAFHVNQAHEGDAPAPVVVSTKAEEEERPETPLELAFALANRIRSIEAMSQVVEAKIANLEDAANQRREATISGEDRDQMLQITAEIDQLSAMLLAIEDKYSEQFQLIAEETEEQIACLRSQIPGRKATDADREQLGALLGQMSIEQNAKTFRGEQFDLQVSESRSLKIVDPLKAIETLKVSAPKGRWETLVDPNSKAITLISSLVELKEKPAQAVRDELTTEYPGFTLDVTYTPKILLHKEPTNG